MLKKKGTLIGAIALTLVLGCGLIFGNAVLAAWAMGSENEPAPISQNELASTGQAITLNTSQMIPQEDNAANKISNANRVSTGMVTFENGQTYIVDYFFDESERVVKASVTFESPEETEQFSYEGEAAERMVMRIIGLDDYNSWARQVGAPTRADRAAELDNLYILGNPDESVISEETAIATAIQLLKEKYALKQETIDRFTVTATFYTKYEDILTPVWWVNLYPTNVDEFSEIGCYWALIDSNTGEAVGLFSAADGRG